MDGSGRKDPIVRPSLPRACHPMSWMLWIIAALVMMTILGSFCPPVHYGMRYTLTSSSKSLFTGTDLELATSERTIDACIHYAWKHELIGTYARTLSESENEDPHFHFNFLAYETQHLPPQSWGRTIWFYRYSTPSIMLFQPAYDLINDTVLSINIVMRKGSWQPPTSFLCSLSNPAIELGNKLRLSIQFYNSACLPTGTDCVKPVYATSIVYGTSGGSATQLVYSHLHYSPFLDRTLPFSTGSTKPFTVIYHGVTGHPVAVFPGHFDLGDEDLEGGFAPP